MIDEQLGAVLFDMDGTLVDSEKVWDVGLRELAARYGGELSDAGRLAMIGTAAREMMALLHADLGSRGATRRPAWPGWTRGCSICSPRVWSGCPAPVSCSPRCGRPG